MNKQGRDVFGLRRDDYRYGRIIIMGSPSTVTCRNYERSRFLRFILMFDIHKRLEVFSLISLRGILINNSFYQYGT